MGTIGGMKLYADAPVRRSLQMVGDLLLLLWIYLCVTTAQAVRDATLTLAGPGEEIAEAGTGLAQRLRDAGDAVGEVPLVGDEVRRPFVEAGAAADQIAAAGQAQAAAVETLAFWLGLAIGALPSLLALAVYLPVRWRFVREATAGRRFLRADKDLERADRLDLFAMRALARQPLHRLARISADPVGDWRRGDAEVVRRLAALELRHSGLGAPESGGTDTARA